MGEARDSDSAVLELFGVTKRYGRVEALRGLDLTLHRGQVYGLLGRNGAGKSTSLRIVMGVTQPDAGTIALFGRRTRPRDLEPRQRIGYVAQEQHFYEWMTPKQLGRFAGSFFPTWEADRFQALLDRFKVPPRKVRTFSGGMKAKLGLALALASRPPLLVLDEPTAGLDPVARREFLDLVLELTQTGDQTTLFSSHLIDDVESIASRIGIIDQGRMVYEGTLEALRAHVRRIILPTEAPGGAARLPSIDDLPVRLLEERRRRGDHILTYWIDDTAAIAAVEQRWAPVALSPVPLEEAFVSLVRGQDNGDGLG